MARTPSGTITSVATAFGAAKAVSIITNAVEAVVTCVGHGFTNGDIVEMTSGWSGINKRAFRIKGVAGDTFTLERCNTSNVNLFTPGAGIGTVRKPTDWVQLDRTMNHSGSGGDVKTANVKFAETDVEVVLPDGFTAVQRTFEMDADMIGTPGYDALVTLTQVQTDTIVKRLAKTGAFQLICGKVALNEEEIEQEGSIVRVKGSILGQGRSTRYPSA